LTLTIALVPFVTVAIPNTPRTVFGARLWCTVIPAGKVRPTLWDIGNTSLAGTIWFEAFGAVTIPNAPWTVVGVLLGCGVGGNDKIGPALRHVRNAGLSGTILLVAIFAITVPNTPKTRYPVLFTASITRVKWPIGFVVWIGAGRPLGVFVGGALKAAKFWVAALEIIILPHTFIGRISST